LEQTVPAAQSATVVHEVRQPLAPHEKAPHGDVVAAAQVPALSQVRAEVAMPDEQVADSQIVSAPG
jgi:hypothetical protein